MPTVINGLPAHILLIHVVIVLVPLGALFTVLSAVWPVARRKLGFISPLTCLIALIFVPITTNAGYWLKNHIHASGQLEDRILTHEHLARYFFWYVLPLFLVSVAVWWLGRSYEFGVVAMGKPDDAALPSSGGTGGLSGGAVATRAQPQTGMKVLPQWQSIVIAVVAVVVSVIVVWQLYRIGDAGSRSVWGNVVSN
ncbi:MAG TPA: hypothetical protein VH395_05785 [Jatrophihabitantaceae bacterium]